MGSEFTIRRTNSSSEVVAPIFKHQTIKALLQFSTNLSAIRASKWDGHFTLGIFLGYLVGPDKPLQPDQAAIGVG